MKTEPNNGSMSWGDVIHQLSSAPNSNPPCRKYVPDPVEEELWRQDQERRKAAEKEELMNRATEVVKALRGRFIILEDENPEPCATNEAIAEIILPFLSKPQP